MSSQIRSHHTLQLAILWVLATWGASAIITLASSSIKDLLFSAMTAPIGILVIPVELLYMLTGYPALSVMAFAVLLGLLQMLVLRRWVPKATLWLPITAISIIVGWSLALALGLVLAVVAALTGGEVQTPTPYFGTLPWSVAAFIAGLCVGIGQHLFMRKLAISSPLWIPITAALWAIGYSILRTDIWMSTYSTLIAPAPFFNWGNTLSILIPELLYRLSIATAEGLVTGAGTALVLVTTVASARQTRASLEPVHPVVS